MGVESERASVPTKYTLRKLKSAYWCLEKEWYLDAAAYLNDATSMTDDPRERNDIESVISLLDKPQEAMARIADILTCGGRVFDEFSEFLKPK